MNEDEVSIHRLRVFLFVRRSDAWLTNNEIAVGAEVAPRTARQHTRALVDMGVFDQAAVFPGHRYQLAKNPKGRSYIARLERAAEAFGLEGQMKV